MQLITDTFGTAVPPPIGTPSQNWRWTHSGSPVATVAEESGRGQPHSKTLSRDTRRLVIPPGFGVRLSSAALVVSKCARWQAYLPLSIAIAAALVLYCFNPIDHSFYPGCSFHATTGLHCPGCGCLRAMHQLLHGHVRAAFHFNPLFVASLPLFLLHFTRAGLGRLRGDPAAFDIKTIWLWLGGAILLLFGILRNLPFDTFAWMRP